MGRVKIILDADVVIDFIDGGHLFDLPKILPLYDFVILDIVLNDELGKWAETGDYILRQVEWIKTAPKLSIIKWAPDIKMQRIYAELRRTKDKGESACMAYCQTRHQRILPKTRNNVRNLSIPYVVCLAK